MLGLKYSILLIVILASILPSVVTADEGTDFFEKKIRPVLVEHCYKCHSAKHDSTEGGLRVDHREAMRDGGDSGSAVVPENIEESLLIAAILYNDDFYQMPPDNKLPDRVIADFKKWIEMGAPDPRDPPEDELASDTTDGTSAREELWSLAPLRQTPQWEHRGFWSASPIDARIQSQLEEADLKTGERAPRETLIRRAYLTLWGLPPTPESIAEFLEDTRPDAWPRLIDQLLASPRFGERFGRHWLDVARYADSSGGGRIQMFQDAWRYRDYVIKTFNQDRSFDDFVREQMAGDLLSSDSIEERNDQLTGLGFLMLGAINYELQDKELLRMEVVDEQLDTMGRAFLGLSFGCARCHDHKFDPISTEDYYSMAGVFRSTKSLVPGNVSGFEHQQLHLPQQEQEAWKQYRDALSQLNTTYESAKAEVEQTDQQLNELAEALTGPHWIVDEEQAELHGNWTQSRSVKPYFQKGYHHSKTAEDRATYHFPTLAPGEYELQITYTANPNRTSSALVIARPHEGSSKIEASIDQRKPLPPGKTFVSLGALQLQQESEVIVELRPQKLDGVLIADAVRLVSLTSKDSDPQSVAAQKQQTQRRRKLTELRESQQATAEQLKQQLSQLQSAAPSQPPRVMGVKDEATPADAFVCVRGNVHHEGPLVPRGPPALFGDSSPSIAPNESGRLTLADWLLKDARHLTYRVFTNRLWHHTFGQGIVPSCDDFGITGRLPSDPVLLDMLAQEFEHQQASPKAMIRKFVISSSFQVQSAVGPAQPGSTVAWGHSFRPRRLEAEAIRDSLLSISGELNDHMGGPAFPAGLKTEFGYTYPGSRRSIYLPVFRNTLNEVFEVFDFANPNFVSGRRSTSTLSTQALWMMNSDFTRRRAASMTQNLIQQFGPHAPASQVDWIYRQALGRAPTDKELQVAVNFLAREPAEPEAQLRKLTQVIMGTIEFRYIH